jgi:hypothetical protein
VPREPLPRPGQTVVFVLDRSASMGERMSGFDRFAHARAMIVDRLRRLAPSNRFQIVAYNGQAELLRLSDQADVPDASGPHRDQAERWLAGLEAEGRSDHLGALRRALLCQPDVIYWFTDGDDLGPEFVRKLSPFLRGRARLNTVALTPCRDPAVNPLRELAQLTGGVYQVAAP